MSTVIKAGRYEIREELGRGAMGVVYRAHDPVIGRDVAVKTMRLSEAGTGMAREELIARFQTEARAAGLLTHPNIVVVFDAGEEEGVFYITMEMVEGRSLQTLIDAHQLFPLPRVMRLMEQACSALDFAHQRNVVHRDIKPANLMLTSDDSLKITDFGTAKILQFGTAQTAHVMGTPSYMSPEQVKGKPVDGRSDIFALGVILYELMTGEKPFPGQNITTVIYKIINEEPIPPRSLDSSIHQGLSAVITRALAKDPAARFQNCSELLEALKNYRDLVGPEAAANRMRPARSAEAKEGTQSAAAQLQPAASASISPVPAREIPAHPISQVILQEEEVAKKRGNFLLTLALLAVIGFIGYRVSPQMLDIWQRLHVPADTPAISSKASSQVPTPETSAETPIAQPDAAPATLAATTLSTGSNSAPQQNPVQTPAPDISARAAAKPSEPVAPAAAPARAVSPKAVEKSSTAPRATGVAPISAAGLLKSNLVSDLANTPLAAKVKMQVAGNTLALSGQLTAREHGELLNYLHNVPADVRVVDNIGYLDEVNPTPAASATGWVWIRSTPPGAQILLDGNDTKFRSPARVEVPQGEHEITLTLRGFTMARRTVLVRPGQSLLFNELLTNQQ